MPPRMKKREKVGICENLHPSCRCFNELLNESKGRGAGRHEPGPGGAVDATLEGSSLSPAWIPSRDLLFPTEAFPPRVFSALAGWKSIPF